MQDRTHKSASQSGNLENQKQTNKHFRNITSYRCKIHAEENIAFKLPPLPYSFSMYLVEAYRDNYASMFHRKFSGFFIKEKMPRLSFIFAPHLLPRRRQQLRHLTFLATKLAHFFLQDILFSKLLLLVAH